MKLEESRGFPHIVQAPKYNGGMWTCAKCDAKNFECCLKGECDLTFWHNCTISDNEYYLKMLLK